MNSDFFDRPNWQQYLLCVLPIFSIFLVSYLFFIVDIKHQTEQQIQLYQIKVSEIELLQVKLTRYYANKKNSLSMISESELALAIARNHLTLRSFNRHETDSIVNWDIEINGQFIDFMNLITSFNDEYFYLDFHHLIMEKQQDEQLKIIFTLLFKKEIE